MAKAVEWAERFEAAADLDAELVAFVREIGDIAGARGGTPNAVEGAVREQKAKFAAVCARTGRVTEGLWPALMAAHGREYMRGVQVYLRGSSQQARGAKRGRGRAA